jgi:hypothetical protein
LNGRTLIERTEDIWQYSGSAIIAITTNGSVAGNGKAIIGRGVARQAAGRYVSLAETLGNLITLHGNHVHYLGHLLVSFPVEETAWSYPDLRIIARSAKELRTLADSSGWRKIVVPRPGCGGGGLDWPEVKPLLEPWYDERFMVIHQPT